MSIGSENQSSALENLSAMADGEVDSAAAARACAAWRDDASVRVAWHSYQLIGDVLRSEDLAMRHDASLVMAVRARLAGEPTVLAPEVTPAQPIARPASAARSARWSWVAPSAVAAGFVMVAGALMVTRQSTPGGDAAALTAAAARFDRSSTRDGGLDSMLQPRASTADVKLVRDPRLDRYLAAHQQFAGSTALGVPSGFLRNAAAEAPNR